MRITKLNILLIISVLLIIGGCANISSPTGGPKDTIPPELMEEVPKKGTLNFEGNKIRVYFDEFVKLKDLNKQFISSPPLNKPPKATLKGKSVEFRFDDTLLENTTYNLNFGNAIVDVNEGNAFVNYYFAFSTGDYIDSLQISGNLYNATDLNPVEDVLILLYDNIIFYDSIPYFDLPSYIGKTDASGRFNISYMRGGNYKVFALKDLNKNRIFDQPNENIAFLDSLIIPEISVEIQTDTIHNDSLGTDSIVTNIINVFSPDSIVMYMFEEENSKQYLKSFTRDKKEQFVFVFNDKLDADFSISGIGADLSTCLYSESSVTGDTLNVWITDSLVFNIDTLKLNFNYLATDTLGELSELNDTLKMVYKQAFKRKKAKKKKPKDNEVIKLPQISIDFNSSSGKKLGLNNRFFLTSAYPINNFDKSKLSLFIKKKEEFVSLDYKLVQDSVIKRKYFVDFEIKEETVYKLVIDTNAFANNYGLFNDTIINEFSSQSLAFYGRILLNISNVKQNVIVQLLSTTDAVVSEVYVSEDSEVVLEYLPANTYKLKLIYDDNGNKKWDTGKYLDQLQPERVKFYKEDIIVKSNWDIEAIWDIEL